MKSLVIYYSFSGHAEKVAKIFSNALRSKGEVDSERLTPKNEITSFFGQCRAAFTGKRAELAGDVKSDASPYDILIIGSPVWAFAPTPAVNAYLDKLNGLHGKKAVIFLTSGSGAGVKRCFENIKAVLKAKGASDIKELNIPDRKLNDESFIRSSVEKILSSVF